MNEQINTEQKLQWFADDDGVHRLRSTPDGNDSDHRAGISAGDWEGKWWSWTAFPVGYRGFQSGRGKTRQGSERTIPEAKAAAFAAVMAIDAEGVVCGES